VTAYFISRAQFDPTLHRLFQECDQMDLETLVHSSFSAIEHGAALVYHKVLATGVQVTEWEIDHPTIAPLVQSGLDYALGVLMRFGVPVGTIAVVSEDILAALKALAAADATVPSVSTVTTTIVSEANIGAAIAAAVRIDAAAAAGTP
jgi:hypothetical protein